MASIFRDVAGVGMSGQTARAAASSEGEEQAGHVQRRPPTFPGEQPMRKWMLAGTGAAAVLAAMALISVPSWLKARPAAGADEEPGARAAQLPIGQVVLFSSGVGYFQREGAVEGDARVDLSFPVSDINDLIKSMVVRDLDGGHISAV